MSKDYAGREYGYGIQLTPFPVGKTIGHTGGAPGVSAVVRLVPHKGYTLAVMSNNDDGAQILSNYLLWQLQDL